MPEDKSRESEVPSEAKSEKRNSDEGSDAPGSENGNDAPGSQNAPARALLHLRGLLWDGIAHGRTFVHLYAGASLTG